MLPHISAWASYLLHLDRIWEFSSLFYICLVFLLCLFLFLSILDFFFFMLCFFTPSLASSSLFFLFTHLSAFFFNSLLTYVLCSARSLMFLSFNAYGMLYNKFALRTKGRPNFRTCDAFWINGHVFLYHMHLEKLEKPSQENCRVSTEQRVERINTGKWNWCVCSFYCDSTQWSLLFVSLWRKQYFIYVYTYVHIHTPSINLEEIGFTLCLKNRFRMNMISICIYFIDRYG